jgi:hypothetical protein
MLNESARHLKREQKQERGSKNGENLYFGIIYLKI